MNARAAHQLINQDSGEQEYYTPTELTRAAEITMGSIDLDPASSRAANLRVGAKYIYTKEDDGLSKPWFGRVWMNHPFSKGEEVCDPEKCKRKTCKKRGYHCVERVPSNAEWINALMYEFGAGRVRQFCNLTFAATSEEWFRPLYAFPQCFLSPRTNFYLLDGSVKKGVTKGSVVTYGGPNVEAFIRNFSPFGFCKLPA